MWKHERHLVVTVASQLEANQVSPQQMCVTGGTLAVHWQELVLAVTEEQPCQTEGVTIHVTVWTQALQCVTCGLKQRTNTCDSLDADTAVCYLWPETKTTNTCDSLDAGTAVCYLWPETNN